MEVILIVGVIILGVIFFVFRINWHKNRIEEYIKSMGGEVINIERRNFFTGLGPFMVVGKGRIVYRIEYRLGDETREGWVRFGGLLGPDWKL